MSQKQRFAAASFIMCSKNVTQKVVHCFRCNQCRFRNLIKNNWILLHFPNYKKKDQTSVWPFKATLWVRIHRSPPQVLSREMFDHWIKFPLFAKCWELRVCSCQPCRDVVSNLGWTRQDEHVTWIKQLIFKLQDWNSTCFFFENQLQNVYVFQNQNKNKTLHSQWWHWRETKRFKVTK